MDRNRPAIERRLPVDLPTVERNVPRGKRLLVVVLALGIAAGVIYVPLVKLRGVVEQPGFPSTIDWLLAKISGAAGGDPTPVSTAHPGRLDALHAAIRSADLHGYEAALDKLPRAELDQPVNGMTALMWAASTGNAKLVRDLLARGANADARGAHQRTALQYAAEKDRRQAARLLLDAGADIDGVDNGSLSPLIMAADRNYTELALLFIERGSNVNIQNIQGWTALMDAAETGNVRVVKALLAAGARTQARHHNGSTAMDFARAGNHQEVIRMLNGQAKSPPHSANSNAVTSTSAPIDRRTSPLQKGERQ